MVAASEELATRWGDGRAGRCCSRAIERARLRATTPDASLRTPLLETPRSCSGRSRQRRQDVSTAGSSRRRGRVSAQETPRAWRDSARPAAPPVDHECDDESGPAISGCRCGRATGLDHDADCSSSVARATSSRGVSSSSRSPRRPAGSSSSRVRAGTPSSSSATRRLSRRSRAPRGAAAARAQASSDGSRQRASSVRRDGRGRVEVDGPAPVGCSPVGRS